MSTAPEELGYATDAQIAAAREIIRSHGQGKLIETVSIWELLDQLGEKFPTTPAMYRVLNLIWQLWSDPNIDQVPSEDVDFAWRNDPC